MIFIAIILFISSLIICYLYFKKKYKDNLSKIYNAVEVFYKSHWDDIAYNDFYKIEHSVSVFESRIKNLLSKASLNVRILNRESNKKNTNNIGILQNIEKINSNLKIQIEYYEELTQELEVLNNKQNKKYKNLLTLKKSLEKSNEDLEEFALIASHDLKSPLRAVLFLVDELREYSSDAKHSEVIDDIKNRLYDLMNLLSGLLQYAHVGSREQLTKEVCFEELVFEIFNSLGDFEKINLSCENLPRFKTNIIPLKIIVQNLLSNAIDFRDDKRESSFIKVSSSLANGLYKFVFEDNGVGVKEEYFEKIFKIFESFKNESTSKIKGTGVGLAAARKAVSQVGCKIYVEKPKDGVGSKFVFTWPQVYPQEPFLIFSDQYSDVDITL